ncbi:MAG: cytochrome c nitrite reductase small subunit [Bdellovibrionales bacterium RIFOXYC1_FULL_54_43]|nr:MAG: cytochrome c nitrite reductase small subunit [Bdellovibrionales bacterium RIFOXYC1_FULL_54_43]OFZ83033.1 MAG: cytochrome c nitrite reductase small subunit [Bdellovibrionales bacterium RIFOXYD1_FULL_55_31]
MKSFRADHRLALTILLGIAFGLGAFTFFYAEGLSYFSSNPKACVNCHVMNHQYDSWSNSGHHHVATCNDCHLPHNLIPKLLAKARNGWNHSLAFTLENFSHPIIITRHNYEILQKNCIRCHSKLVTDAIMIPAAGSHVSCIHCHRNVGHMPIH